MPLKFATQQLDFHPKDATLQQTEHGKVVFNSRQQRDMAAQLTLERLVKINHLQSRPSQAQARLKSCFWPLLSPRDKQTQWIRTNNNLQIKQAIEANNAEIEDNALTQDHPRYKHLNEENSRLNSLSPTLRPSEQILGFIGDSKSNLVRFRGGDVQSFAAHGYAVIRDYTTKNVTLKAVVTDQLNQLLPDPRLQNNENEAEDQLSFGLAGLLLGEDCSESKENKAIKSQMFPPSPLKQHRQKLRRHILGEKPAQRTGAEAAAAACCSLVSLDELAGGLGRKVDHDHGEIIVPTNGSEAAITAVVSYASLAGIKISHDIYKNFHQSTLAIQSAKNALKLAELENENRQNSPFFLDKIKAIQACRVFLQHQATEAKFQKNVAGKFSCVASALIFIGQFVAKISPIGLFALSGFGALHVANLSKQCIRARQDLKACESGSIEQHHFEKKVKNLSLALLSWTAYTAGTAILGATSLGMIASALTIGLPITAIAVPVGLSLLGLGIAGTLVFNNIMTSKRFLPGRPMLSKLDVRNPPTQQQSTDSLKQAAELRTLIKDYRAKTFQRMRDEHKVTLLKNVTYRWVNKAGLYATLGLKPGPFMRNKFKIKGKYTQKIGTQNQQQTRHRLQTLDTLFTIEAIKNPSFMKNKTDVTDTFNKTAFDLAKQALLPQESQSTSKPGHWGGTHYNPQRQGPSGHIGHQITDRRLSAETPSQPLEAAPIDQRTQHLQSLHHLLNLLENTPKSDQMMKFFAQKVLQSRHQIRTKVGPSQQYGALSKCIPERVQSTWIHPNYEAIFQKQGSQASSSLQQYTTMASDGMQISSFQEGLDQQLLDSLGGLYKTRPCCPANKFANSSSDGMLKQFREVFHEQSHHSIDDIKNLESLLYECVDQYLLYQARNDAKEEIALQANYLRAFQPDEPALVATSSEHYSASNSVLV